MFVGVKWLIIRMQLSPWSKVYSTMRVWARLLRLPLQNSNQWICRPEVTLHLSSAELRKDWDLMTRIMEQTKIFNRQVASIEEAKREVVQETILMNLLHYLTTCPKEHLQPRAQNLSFIDLTTKPAKLLTFLMILEAGTVLVLLPRMFKGSMRILILNQWIVLSQLTQS